MFYTIHNSLDVMSTDEASREREQRGEGGGPGRRLSTHEQISSHEVMREGTWPAATSWMARTQQTTAHLPFL